MLSVVAVVLVSGVPHVNSMTIPVVLVHVKTVVHVLLLVKQQAYPSTIDSGDAHAIADGLSMANLVKTKHLALSCARATNAKMVVLVVPARTTYRAITSTLSSIMSMETLMFNRKPRRLLLTSAPVLRVSLE